MAEHGDNLCVTGLTTTSPILVGGLDLLWNSGTLKGNLWAKDGMFQQRIPTWTQKGHKNLNFHRPCLGSISVGKLQP